VLVPQLNTPSLPPIYAAVSARCAAGSSVLWLPAQQYMRTSYSPQIEVLTPHYAFGCSPRRPRTVLLGADNVPMTRDARFARLAAAQTAVAFGSGDAATVTAFVDAARALGARFVFVDATVDEGQESVLAARLAATRTPLFAEDRLTVFDFDN